MGDLGALGLCDLAAGDRPGFCSWCGAPLPKGRRRWCSDAHGRAWADSHIWAWARQVALERDGFRCVRCGGGGIGAGPVLEVHHDPPLDKAKRETYARSGCHHHPDRLATLCRTCHRGEHTWRRHGTAKVQQLQLEVA